MNYYYLAASLPTLALESVPPLSPDAFRSACRQHLTAADCRALEEALDLDPAGSAPRGAVARAWWTVEVALRNAVVRARAARLRREAGAHLRPDAGYDGETEEAVAEALARGTPAEREMELDRYRWRKLDALAGLNPFALRALAAYGLKLRLADRWARLSDEEGLRAADAMVKAASAA